MFVDLKLFIQQAVGYINSNGSYVGLDSSLWSVKYVNNYETLRLELRYDISSEAAGSTAVVKFYSY